MSSQHYSILLVEDNTVRREALVQLLELEGFRVIAAAHRHQALALLAEDRSFDLVISNWEMSSADGSALVSAVHARQPTTPVLVFSGCNAAALPCAGKYLHILQKPCRPDVLLANVGLLLSASR